MPELIDTIVRFHDVGRLPELTRCIFSLTGQTYRPLRIILCLQRFSEKDVAATTAAHAPDPQARVSPAPRSHTRMRSALRSSTCTNSTFVLAGNRSLVSSAGPRERTLTADASSTWGSSAPTRTPRPRSPRARA